MSSTYPAAVEDLHEVITRKRRHAPREVGTDRQNERAFQTRSLLQIR